MSPSARQIALFGTAALVFVEMPVAYADTVSGSPFSNPLLAQATAPGISPSVTHIETPTIAPSSTILPTDVLPLPQVQNRLTFAENLQLRILQKLPSNFYFSSSCETSFRIETNPFQFPMKRVFLQKLPPPPIMAQLPLPQQQQIINLLKLPDSQDNVFRVLPNVTAGFTLTPHTRLYGNYFMIRDSLFKNVRLNTVINSYGYGIQQDIPLGRRGNLQADIQFRELNQMHQHSVFDFLPSLTASFVLTPRTVMFVNSLLQIRGRKYFQAPTRELDPFYTAGLLYQRNGWSFSASSTFVQNFRNQFGHQAVIPQNNYAIISDFEIARRLVRTLPGLQAFVRAEPIWNMHSHNRPGLAGTDFRLFYGLRFAMTKPSLTAGLDQLRQQIQEQEQEAPRPENEENKPSAFAEPNEYIAHSLQPIHGMLTPPNVSETLKLADADEDVKIASLPEQPQFDYIPIRTVLQAQPSTQTAELRPALAEAEQAPPVVSTRNDDFSIMVHQPSSQETAAKPSNGTIFMQM